MVATEAADKPAAHPLQETWGKNERMRHIPSVEWIVWKLDSDLRRRVEKLLVPFTEMPHDDPRCAAVENELRGLCRAIDRFADAIRHNHRTQAQQHDLPHRISAAIGHAVSALHSLDSALFGRRYPLQTFERSKGEAIYGALLVIIDHINRVTTLIRTIDRGIDARLYEDLVQLQEPMRETPMA